jgi:hypothetical protein
MFGGTIARMKGDFITACAFHEDSVALWRSLGDQIGLAQALANLGLTLLDTGELAQAKVVLGEALALARATGDPFALRLALSCAPIWLACEGNTSTQPGLVARA